jgi:hypothetical protein
VAAIRTIGLFSARYFPRHKLLLLTVAMNSDVSGKGRPLSYPAFCEVLEIKDWRTARSMMQDLVEKNLLHPPIKVKAPGKSNGFMYCWDLNLAHPAYPDEYENSPCKNQAENADSKKISTCKKPTENADSEKPSTYIPEDLNLQDRQLEPAKSEISTCKNLRENADNALPTQTLTQNQPTTLRADGWACGKAADMGSPSGFQREELEALEKIHGSAMMENIFDLWQQRPQGWKDLTAKWRFFIEEFPAYLERAVKAKTETQQKAADRAHMELQSDALRESNRHGLVFQTVLEQMQAGTYTPPQTAEEKNADEKSCTLEELLEEISS